jgi:hypothetical protein
MATIAKELHDGLVTVLDKLNTMAAVLQRIDTEQQDCIYKLEVMAGIQLADAKPPLTPLPSLLLTPSLVSTNLVQSPLETMDAMLTLHPDLQRIGDEQQPMSMDGLSALHPDLQQIIDKQHAMSTLAPQPAVQSALLLPPAPPFSASTGAAAACGTEPRPSPAALMSAAATYRPEPRQASSPASLTTDVIPSCGPDHPSVLPLSASTGAATACGTAPRPVAPPAAPTATTTAIHGPSSDRCNLLPL